LEHSSGVYLIRGNNVQLCENILTGFPKFESIVDKAWDEEPKYPASSKRRPIYTGWKRCHRNANWKNTRYEALHLVREDGTIHYVTRFDDAPGDRATAGSFDCNVGTAFTNFFTNLAEPDYLISSGCMSFGQVLSVGPLHSLALHNADHRNRLDK
jgi:hypothetical protein